MPAQPHQPTRLADLPEPQRLAIINAAHEPKIRRGRLIVSTSGKRWLSHWVHPKVADALVRRGLFENMPGYGSREILWTAAGADLAAGIVKAVEEAAALPDLTPGQTVRVYRAGDEPIRFMELVDQYKEWPATVPPSMEPFETGTLREELDGAVEGHQRYYRVTVVKDDKELFIDWTSRYRVRTPTEPAPGTPLHALVELRPVQKMDTPTGLFAGVCTCGKETAMGTESSARKAFQDHADAKNAQIPEDGAS